MCLPALLLVGACSRAPSDALEQQLKTARSAAATARMTHEAWLGEHVPAHYARRTLQAMRDQIEAASRQIGKADLGSPARGATLRAPLAQTADAIGRAQSAVAAADRPAAARAMQDAKTAAAILSLPVPEKAAGGR